MYIFNMVKDIFEKSGLVTKKIINNIGTTTKHTSVYLTALNKRKFDFRVLISALMNIKYDAQFVKNLAK